MAWRESSWVCQWSRAELRKHHKTTFSVPEAGSVRSRRALKGMCVRDRSGLLPKSLTRKTEAVIRKGLQTSRFAEADGKCPEILDMPPPISAQQQCRKSSHYLQSTEEKRFLKNTPHTPDGAAKAEALLSRSPSNTPFPHFLPSVWYGVQHAGSTAPTAFCLHSNPGKRLAEAMVFLSSSIPAEGSQHTG